MLDQETKRRIDAARDVLVGKVPDPKSQIEQITIALIYKFMDDMDKASQELGGEPRFFTGEYKRFAWSKLMDPRLGGQDRMNLYVEALDKLPLHKHMPLLFRDIFKGAILPYRDPNTLSMFLKEIDSFVYDHSERLGDAFEYLLSLGSSQSEAGQFRTPRHLINFIVDLVDPKKDESILDPACGTAGFLIEAYKHILQRNTDKKTGDKLTPDERQSLVNNFVGYDISPDMVRLSRANLYLHGFQDPKIFEYDTLTSEERWQEKFDVILANPPFMTPKGGITPHSKFSIKASRSEILFLDYIVEHLTQIGKAGVIIPEGVLHNDYQAYKLLRKKLVENNLLYAAIELPHGMFKPYASVKTHILFTDAGIAKAKKSILFVRVNNDGFTQTDARKPIKINDLPLVKDLVKQFRTGNLKQPNSTLDFIEVDKQVLLNDKKISLIGRRYKAIKIAEKSKFPVTKLDSTIVSVIKGKTAIESAESGMYPFVVTAKEKKSADHFDYDCQAVCIPTVSSTGHGHASIRRIHYIEGKFALANIMCGIIVKDTTRLNVKYLFYILSSKKDDILTPLMTGTSNVSLDVDELHDVEIPLPPLEKQLALVKELEKEEEDIKKLEYEVEQKNEMIMKRSEKIWES